MSTDATLALLREALQKAADPGELAKASTFMQPGSPTVGLQTYNLEAPAKELVPQLTPIRNRLARVKATGGMQANWKAITGRSSGGLTAGVAEGVRGGSVIVTTAEYYAAFRTIGIEASASEEAVLAAESFDDLRARAANSALLELMRKEEKLILGGNSSRGLGTTPTPTLAASTLNGTVPASTVVSVICVALTFEAIEHFSVATGIPSTITRANMDGTTTTYNAGAAKKSTAVTVTTGGGTATNSITATVAAVQGAAGYAWYAGAAGSEYLFAITSSSQVVVTAMPTNVSTPYPGTAAALTLDYSQNSLVFDGLMALNANPLSGAYWYAAPPGTGMTADGYGGVVEIENVLQWYYDTLRASPARMWVSSQEGRLFRTKFLGGNPTNTPTRFTFNINAGQIVGGGKPKGYINMFSNDEAEIPIMVHPYLPKGTIIFEMDEIPYPNNHIGNVMQILGRRDYYQREWPQITRSYQYGVYSDEVLQHYFPQGIAIISNLANV